MARAHYEIVKDDSLFLTISDVGQDRPSVTNDAEGVVLELHQVGILGSRRLLYYDSEGRLDELVHDGRGTFLGFSPGTPTIEVLSREPLRRSPQG
jgi:hypothetical protein